MPPEYSRTSRLRTAVIPSSSSAALFRFGALRAGNQIKPSGEQEIVIVGEFAVGRKQLRYIADMPAEFCRLCAQVEPGESGVAARGGQHGCEHLDQRAIARSV